MRRIRAAVAAIVDDLGAHEDEADHEVDVVGAEQSPLAQLEKVAATPATQALSERWRIGKPVLSGPGAK